MGNVLFTNVRILDGTGAQPFAGEVLVQGNRILKVGRGPRSLPTAGIDTIDAAGATLMPGMTEAHTHFSWNDQPSLGAIQKMPLEELIDLSLNSTLSRTLLTAGTTFVAILGLVLFGGDVIRSFTISMLFGVVIGTFSSIYVAAPMLILFKLRSDAFDKDKDEPGRAKASTPAV